MTRILFLGFILLVGTACLPGNQRVLLEVDGQRRWIAFEGDTAVKEILEMAEVDLGDADRVEPASYTLVEPDMHIRVIRVTTRTVYKEQDIPFDREIRRDASLPQGESRIAQLGENGRARLKIQLTLEDGVEIGRKVVGRETVTEPTKEILVVGTKGSGEAVTFSGSIVYLAQGNAWIMEEDSTEKRALTRTGDLDGHVFSLSPDGRLLLFSRTPLGGASGQSAPLNMLWIVDTLVRNEKPRPLQIENVIWAGWQPCASRSESCPRQVAYSTADRVPGSPGWRANNDLWQFRFDATGRHEAPEQVLPASNSVYGWWGRSWQWSPDGTRIAWGDASRIGVVDLGSGEEEILARFTPYETYAPWVWVPQLSWKPDGKTLYANVHQNTASPQTTTGAQRVRDSAGRSHFDLWRIGPAESEAEIVLRDVGPFALPQWLDTTRLLYGQVEDKGYPVSSRYYLMLREGASAPRHLFPSPDQPGVDTPWGAYNASDNSLIAVWQGDLYLVPLGSTGDVQPLTAEGGASQPQWGP